MTPFYTFVIPTYRRADTLTQALEHLCRLNYHLGQTEVLVLDNGEINHTSEVGEQFVGRLPLTYLVNPQNLGPGGSLARGLALAKGERIVLMNDDALIPTDFLRRCDETFGSDPQIGCIGFRAVEKDYHEQPGGIGQVDRSGVVIGNFDRSTDQTIDVEHVYGFCYAITRAARDAGGCFDKTLLAQPYASGNRIETDHCLTIRRLGFRVVYDGRLAVTHLAKPRTDIAERSARWRINEIRNTFYLFLKHYGLFGKGFMAARYGLLHDLGIVSAVKHPTRKNWEYVWTGLTARASAVAHYFKYLSTGGAH